MFNALQNLLGKTITVNAMAGRHTGKLVRVVQGRDGFIEMLEVPTECSREGSPKPDARTIYITTQWIGEFHLTN